jgi:hypothetical protein
LYVTGSTLAFTGFNPPDESNATVIGFVCALVGTAQSKTANAAVRQEAKDKRANLKTTGFDLRRLLDVISFSSSPLVTNDTSAFVSV